MTRHSISFLLALVVAAAIGCAAGTRGTQGGLTSGGSAAVLPAQGGGGASSVPVVGSVAAAGSYVAGGIKQTSSALVSFVTPKSKVIPADDPTTLAGKSTKPTPKLHVALAEMHEKSGNISKAREHYEAALKEDPRNLRGLLGYAHLLDRQQKFDEAIAKYRLACKYHPSEPKAYNDLALCYDRQKKFDDAVKALSKAVTLEPKRKLYRNNLAVVLIKTGRRDEALAQLTAVHGPAVAHYNLGSLFYRQGKQTEAAAEFAEAARIEPEFTAARKWSEQIAAAGNRPVEAGQPVARVAGVYPASSTSVEDRTSSNVTTNAYRSNHPLRSPAGQAIRSSALRNENHSAGGSGRNEPGSDVPRSLPPVNIEYPPSGS